MLGGVKNAPRSLRAEVVSGVDGVTSQNLTAGPDAAPKRMFAILVRLSCVTRLLSLWDEGLGLTLDDGWLSVEIAPGSSPCQALRHGYLRYPPGAPVVEPNLALIVAQEVCIGAVCAMCDSKRHVG